MNKPLIKIYEIDKDIYEFSWYQVKITQEKAIEIMKAIIEIHEKQTVTNSSTKEESRISKYGNGVGVYRLV